MFNGTACCLACCWRHARPGHCAHRWPPRQQRSAPSTRRWYVPPCRLPLPPIPACSAPARCSACCPAMTTSTQPSRPPPVAWSARPAM
ncbi:hypothetical protein WR25_21374 [Diploscapter pachys]|uniref:Uncharacterized protein n=1 Tax=Diploscapter pachys TaxID=2018661 RepID=A0A2A2M5J8_9BILA|nr:hypothetical protein WR25_21374 [Diploscapter pachys]